MGRAQDRVPDRGHRGRRLSDARTQLGTCRVPSLRVMTVKWHIRCFLAFALALLSAESLAADIICDAYGPGVTRADPGRVAKLYPSGLLPSPDSCRNILLKGTILPGTATSSPKFFARVIPSYTASHCGHPVGQLKTQ